MILNKAKDYYENGKERLREQAIQINTEIYLQKKKIKRENLEKTNITIYLKKKNKH